MRFVTIHSDFIEFQPLKQAIKDAEETTPEKKRVEECLVVLTAVEKGDEREGNVSKKAVEEIAGICSMVKTNRVVLYPWVHLTSSPAPPSVALNVLKEIEKGLKDAEYEVVRAPFGYYKLFDMRCKGHPLSELSREIRVGEKKEEIVSESLKKEEKVKSRFCVLTPEGELIPHDEFDYSKYPNLNAFMDYEFRKVRAYQKEPPHIKLMKEHGIADYEPGSDIGNFRWPPSGRLIKRLLEKDISDFCIDYGAMEVETPIMYDLEHPALRKYLDRFPARQYVVKSDDKELFLRFAACFGMFLLTRDMVISYKNLPLKMFELTRYSFRREQSGELAGLKRVRALTMPDMHTFARDMDEAKREFESQFYASRRWLDGFGLEFETGFRVQEDFFNENKEWYVKMAKGFGKPVLIELFDIRYAYFITKFEFNFVDGAKKASALSTVQIDVENAETYDITFVDEDGKKKRPLILHTSISGSVERVIYALLEREAMRIEEGKTPALPVWLSPTQVRIIPVSDRHVEYGKEVLEQFKGMHVRVDLDDRSETLSKKIRDGGKEWIPFIAVVGDKEMTSGKMSVKIRETGESREMDLGGLVALVEKETKGRPFEKLTLPVLLSKRPII
jgi:threonyl-tRNA synthetase